MRKKELEKRLIDFSSQMIYISDNLTKSHAAIQLSKQLARSGTSVSLNYGEAQGAESRKDFIHKLGISLKELRETYVCLKLIDRNNLCLKMDVIQDAIDENNELISIFVVSIKTAKQRT